MSWAEVLAGHVPKYYGIWKCEAAPGPKLHPQWKATTGDVEGEGSLHPADQQPLRIRRGRDGCVHAGGPNPLHLTSLNLHRCQAFIFASKETRSLQMLPVMTAA